MIESIWVPKHQVSKVWILVEPLLKSAIMKWLPVWDTADLYDEIQNDTKQLWIAYDAQKERLYGAVITEIITYPRAKIANVMLLGGNNIKEWKDEMGSAIESFARTEGCYALQASGRKGWQNLFPDMFESASIINKILD